jgi:hypothetical protein
MPRISFREPAMASSEVGLSDDPVTLNRNEPSSIQRFAQSDRRAESIRPNSDCLLQSVGYAGKYIARVSADQTDRADDYGENYGKHDRIFRNVLTFLAGPKGT